MKKVLFINHEISPFVPDSELSIMGRSLPQAIQDSGCELRTFMPKWGNINERRGQLHEVQRLSGMNIIINDTDHPLIIKVASIPQTKIQVYFIDNEEYFIKAKSEDDVPTTSCGERAIFFARGVIETMKKLRWSPDVIHCQGWMSAFVPLYIKHAYQDEPSVCNAKIVSSLFNSTEDITLEDDLKHRIAFKDVTVDTLSDYSDDFTMTDLVRLAIQNSDGVIAGSANLKDSIMKEVEASGTKFLPYAGEDFKDAYLDFYDTL